MSKFRTAGDADGTDGEQIMVAPQAACPAQAAVAAVVERLGARQTLEQVGDAEVTVEGDNLRILIRDGSGAALGSRTVAAPVNCQARAEVAAVLIAAWTGEWIKTSLGNPSGGRDSCMIGACSCSPANAKTVSVCDCKDGACFDHVRGCRPYGDGGF